MPSLAQHSALAQPSAFIARIVGPVFTVVGLGLSVSRAAYTEVAEEFVSSSALIYGFGLAMLVAGLVILNTHPRWTPDWRSLITATGWVLACIGTFRILAPNLVMFMGVAANATTHFIASGLLLITGGILTFKGYVAELPQPKRMTSSPGS